MSEADDWVCRIPRAHLRRLATCAGLSGETRIFAAILSELYERTDKTGGAGTASVPKLQRLTGLSRSTVKRALAHMQSPGPLAVVAAEPGHAKEYRMAGGPQAGPPVQLGEPPRLQKRPPYPARLMNPPPGSTGGPPGEEMKKEESPPTPPGGAEEEEAVENRGDGYALWKRQSFGELWAGHQASTGQIQ